MLKVPPFKHYVPAFLFPFLFQDNTAGGTAQEDSSQESKVLPLPSWPLCGLWPTSCQVAFARLITRGSSLPSLFLMGRKERRMTKLWKQGRNSAHRTNGWPMISWIRSC